jgi:hypothetical protein
LINPANPYTFFHSFLPFFSFVFLAGLPFASDNLSSKDLAMITFYKFSSSL